MKKALWERWVDFVPTALGFGMLFLIGAGVAMTLKGDRLKIEHPHQINDSTKKDTTWKK